MTVSDVLMVLGVLLLAAFAGLIFLPAALAVLGVGCLAGAFLFARVEGGPQ